MFERAYAVGGAIGVFKQTLLDNLLRLQDETGLQELALPVGLILILDRANGGDDTGEELIRRFDLIDAESRNMIDFFFLGWNRSATSGLAFRLDEFQSCRQALSRVGVTCFGGYADLLLVDAWLRDDRVALDFQHALHIDLSAAVGSKNLPNVGGFIEGLLRVTEEIRTDADPGVSAVIRISDQLGLATAGRSMVDFVLDKWGKIIGANSLRLLATRSVGPRVDLARI